MTITLAIHFRIRCNYCRTYTAQSYHPRAMTIVCHTCRMHLGTPPCPTCSNRITLAHQPTHGRWRCWPCERTFTHRNALTKAQKRQLRRRRRMFLRTSSCSSVSSRENDDDEDQEGAAIVLPPLPKVQLAKQSELDNSVSNTIDAIEMASKSLASFFTREISFQKVSDVVGNAIHSVSAIDYNTILLAEKLGLFSVLRKQQFHATINALVKRLLFVANLGSECQSLFSAITSLLKLPLACAAIRDNADKYVTANSQTEKILAMARDNELISMYHTDHSAIDSHVSDSLSSSSLNSLQELESSTSETEVRSQGPKTRFYVKPNQEAILVE